MLCYTAEMVRYIPRTSVNIVVAAVFRFPDKKPWSASVIVTAELKRIAVFNTVTTKCLPILLYGLECYP